MDPVFQRLGDVTIQRLEKPRDKMGLQGNSDIMEKEGKEEKLEQNIHLNSDDSQGLKRNFDIVPGPSTNKRTKFENMDFRRNLDLQESSAHSFSENELTDYDMESELESDEELAAMKAQSSNMELANAELETSTDFFEKLVQEPFDDQESESEMKTADQIKVEADDYEYDIKEKLKEMGEISFETVKKGDKPKKTEMVAENEVVVTPAKKTGISEEDPMGERLKSGNLRRNIREVMDETKLDESTLAAQRQEVERLRRVQEQQRLIREVQRQMAQDRVISLLQGGTVPKAGTSGARIGNTVLVKLPNGQTKTMTKLTKKPFDLVKVPKSAIPPNKAKSLIAIKKPPGNLTPSVSIAPVMKRGPQHYAREPSDTDSENEDMSMMRGQMSRPKPREPVTTIDISSDDDCIVVSESENDPSDDVDEDPSNSGMHTNDEFNQPDEQGRVVVNIGHPEGEPDIYLAPQIARIIKPHQIGGIRFLFDNVMESVGRFETSTGFGCILAHSMGLGKTLQVVSFSDIFLRNTPARTILCIMPINTLQNWLAEYNMWLPTEDAACNSPLNAHGEVRARNFNLHVLNDSQKTLAARARVINEWKTGGGVLLIGYEQYRLLALRKHPKSRRKPVQPQEPVDDDKNKQLFDDVHEALVKPGPDLVICDEGHRIKNSHASISLALKQMRTKRRVVLTGYPLQNNLMEYWCMVDFVRPNYLGTKTEFCNMFERPIQNGQCIDSTESDIKLMRYRAHVLHSLLVGFVQRRSHTVLQTALPQKEEYVLLVRMTDFQRTLYETFMNEVVRTQTVPNPLKAFAVCCKIWNHPDVLYYFLKKQAGGEAVDIDLEEVANAVTPSNEPAAKTKKRAKKPSAKKKNSGKPAASVTPYNSSGDASTKSKKNAKNQNQNPAPPANQNQSGFNQNNFNEANQSFNQNTPVNKSQDGAPGFVPKNEYNNFSSQSSNQTPSYQNPPSNYSDSGFSQQSVEYSQNSQGGAFSPAPSITANPPSNMSQDSGYSSYSQANNGQRFSSNQSNFVHPHPKPEEFPNNSNFPPVGNFPDGPNQNFPVDTPNSNFPTSDSAGFGAKGNSFHAQSPNFPQNNQSASYTNTPNYPQSQTPNIPGNQANANFPQNGQQNSQFGPNQNPNFPSNNLGYMQNNQGGNFNQSNSSFPAQASNQNSSFTPAGDVNFPANNFVPNNTQSFPNSNAVSGNFGTASNTNNFPQNQMISPPEQSSNFRANTHGNENFNQTGFNAQNQSFEQGFDNQNTNQTPSGFPANQSNVSPPSQTQVTSPTKNFHNPQYSSNPQSNFPNYPNNESAPSNNFPPPTTPNVPTSPAPNFQANVGFSNNGSGSNFASNNGGKSFSTNPAENVGNTQRNYNFPAANPNQPANFPPNPNHAFPPNAPSSNFSSNSAQSTDFPPNFASNPGQSPNFSSNTGQSPNFASNPNQSSNFPSNPAASPGFPSNPNQSSNFPSNPAASPGFPSNPTQNPGFSSNPNQPQNFPSNSPQSANFAANPNQTANFAANPNQTANFAANPNQSSNFPPNPSQSPSFVSNPNQTPNFPTNPSQSSNFAPNPNQSPNFSSNPNQSSNFGSNQSLNFPSNSAQSSNFTANSNHSSNFPPNSNQTPNFTTNPNQMSNMPPNPNQPSNFPPNPNQLSNIPPNPNQSSNFPSNPNQSPNFATNPNTTPNFTTNTSQSANFPPNSNQSSTFPPNPNQSSNFPPNPNQSSTFPPNPNQSSNFPPNPNQSPNFSTNPGQTSNFPANSNQSSNFASNTNPSPNFPPNSNQTTGFSANTNQCNFGPNSTQSGSFPSNVQQPLNAPNFQQNQNFPANANSAPNQSGGFTPNLNQPTNSTMGSFPPSNTAGNQQQSMCNFPQGNQQNYTSNKPNQQGNFPMGDHQNGNLNNPGQQGGFPQNHPTTNQQNNFPMHGGGQQSNFPSNNNQQTFTGGNFPSNNTNTPQGNFTQNQNQSANNANQNQSNPQNCQGFQQPQQQQQQSPGFWGQDPNFKQPNDSFNNFRPPYSQNFPSNQPWLKKDDINKPIINSPIKLEGGSSSESKPKINIISDIKLSSGGAFDMKKINILSDIKLDPKKEFEDMKEEKVEVKKQPEVPLSQKPESLDEDTKIGNEVAPAVKAPAKEETGIPYDWAIELLKDYVPGIIENSAKMEILFCIIKESIALGDRLLVFSQSLITLDLIEQFLQMNACPGETHNWAKNVNYYRLDGSTSALEREKLINEFNSNPKIYLFLVSTRAGSLGINLIGANRVVVLDASWNPCHDTQAVCRVYRYGQRKPCFVYRLVVDNCLEKKIYDRQINKQGMSDRVVDECNPDAHLTMKDVSTLCWDDAEEVEMKDWSHCKDNYIDVVLQKVLVQYGTRLNKEPFQHESLLVDRKDKQLSSQEKRLAKKGYEREKQAARQPAYSLGGVSRGHRPVASVRPMQQGGERPTRWIPAEHWQRQGMTAQEMTLPLDVVIPTNQPDKGNIVLKAGQKVLVLKSPKGVYMQLETGKIVAIKTAIKVRGKAEEDAAKVKPSTLPPSIKNNSAISVVPQKRAVRPFTPNATKLNVRSIKQNVPNLVSRIQSVTKRVQTAKTKPYQIGQEIARAISQPKSETESHPSSSDEERVFVQEKRHFNFSSKDGGLTIEPRMKSGDGSSRGSSLERRHLMGNSEVEVEIPTPTIAVGKAKGHKTKGGKNSSSGSALERLERSASTMMSDSKQTFQETLDSITSAYPEEEKLSDTSSHASTTHSANQSTQSISSTSDHEVIPVEEPPYASETEATTTGNPPEATKTDIPPAEYPYNNYYGYNHVQPYPIPPPQGYPYPQPPPYDMMGYPQQPQYNYGMYPPQHQYPPGPYDYGQPPPPPPQGPVYPAYHSPYPPPQQYPPPPQGMYPPPVAPPPAGYPEYQYPPPPPHAAGPPPPPPAPYYPPGH